ncbi:alcohol oxidase [Pluteus cervinus]|uniref:Alcohol oxidase n=1 Tax=Pluteus cervinus TaxID=181527 RepID=A0ACD3B837_9AGAR|nr:alcohol oxidase [Pluteus cervinus]
MSILAHDTYDIIFAGGGAAACVTAGRLAAASPSLRILVLEAGSHTRDVQDHIQPARYFKNLTTAGPAFTYHIGKPSPALLGRAPIIPSGRCVGGGSGVNFTMYTRASASDYDDWENQFANPGWGSKDIIPLLKKAETYQVDPSNPLHGSSGPIKVSLAPDEINVGLQYLEVAAAYDPTRPLTDDVNAFYTCNAYGRWPRYVDAATGRRSDTAHHYIYNQLDHNQNLVVQDRSRVVRVIIQNNIAVGVEYVDDTIGRAKGTPQLKTVYASRLVVVAAGAFGSPAVLERSGIGSKEVLQKNDIEQIVDLPGVGEHYMDHNLMFVPYVANEDADTLDVVFRSPEDELQAYNDLWRTKGQGLLSHSGLDAGIKIRPDEEDLKELGPDFEKRWNEYFASAPDKPIMWIGTLAAYAGVDPAVPRGKYYSMTYYTEYPASTGRVHVSGGLDPYKPLDVEPGFLNEPADLVVLRWAYKKGREFGRRMKSYRGELAISHPLFPEGSEARAQLAVGPVGISAPDIKYSKEDDDAIDEYHRRTVETTWHSIGTCAMKPREVGGVVDSRLNVYGVQRLKVADCSIAPGNVSANTYNTAIAIGEKAAVIIAEELGISNV